MLCRNIGIIQHGELVENTSMKNLLSKLKSETFILDLAAKSALPKLEGITIAWSIPRRWRWKCCASRD